MSRFVHDTTQAVNLNAVRRVEFESDGTARFYFDATDYVAFDFGSTTADAREAAARVLGAADVSIYL